MLLACVGVYGVDGELSVGLLGVAPELLVIGVAAVAMSTGVSVISGIIVSTGVTVFTGVTIFAVVTVFTAVSKFAVVAMSTGTGVGSVTLGLLSSVAELVSSGGDGEDGGDVGGGGGVNTSLRPVGLIALSGCLASTFLVTSAISFC